MYGVIEIYTKVIIVKGSLSYCKNWIKNNCTKCPDLLYRDSDNEVVVIREI